MEFLYVVQGAKVTGLATKKMVEVPLVCVCVCVRVCASPSGWEPLIQQVNVISYFFYDSCKKTPFAYYYTTLENIVFCSKVEKKETDCVLLLYV